MRNVGCWKVPTIYESVHPLDIAMGIVIGIAGTILFMIGLGM